MARHADPRPGRRAAGGRRPLRVSVPAVVVCVLVIAAVALGVWWWNLRSATDPISADPVDAYAVVVSSPSCPAGGGTTVRISGTRPAVTATLSGCGYVTDQRLAVQYLRGHPDQIRLAGTTVAGGSGLSGKLLPIGILAAGLIAVLAAVALLVDRRRSRHLASSRGISVADLRRRSENLAPQPPSSRPAPTPTGDPDGEDSTGPDHDGGGTVGAGADRPGSAADPGRVVSEPGSTDLDSIDLDRVDLDSIDPGEPSHLLPGGFVIVDEQLFTHSGTEAAPSPERQPGPDEPRG